MQRNSFIWVPKLIGPFAITGALLAIVALLSGQGLLIFLFH